MQPYEMKRISRWIFWVVLERVCTSMIFGEFLILSGPSYNRGSFYYTYHQKKEMFCITDDISNALTWNSNLNWLDHNLDLNIVEHSYVLHSAKYVYPLNDNLICGMNQTSACSTKWHRTETWKYVSSLTRPMSPVHDNRWEDFNEVTMSNVFQYIEAVPSESSIAVSIRGSSDAHFALCNDHSLNSSCFFIVLGGWKNTVSVLRKCEEGIPESTDKYPSQDCAKPVDLFKGSMLSSIEWRTFVIKWNFKGTITMSIYNSEKEILKYAEPTNQLFIPLHYVHGQNYSSMFLYARSALKMIMKFHVYSYTFSTATTSKLSSPEFMVPFYDRNICIEISISLCQMCLMTFDFVGSDGQKKAAATFFYKKPSNLYDLPIWRNIKINKTLPAEIKQPVTLSINTLLLNNTKQNYPFWAISNVRRCYDGALKIVKIQVSQDYNSSSNYYWPNITCQKVSEDGISTILKASEQNDVAPKRALRQLCEAGKIGFSCSVNCSKLFASNPDCRKLVFCDESGCFCGQGFTNSTCSLECPVSTYGIDCQQICGKCKYEKCSNLDGTCPHGCENGAKSYYLPPYCKIGVGSPPAPNVDVINSTCIRIFLDVKKEYKIITTSVNFEIWMNSSKPFFVSDKIKVDRTSVVIESFAEHLNPGINYRGIGIVHAANQTFRGEEYNFTTPCTESIGFNFLITKNETSITVSTRDLHVNDSCPYTWYTVQLHSDKDKLFEDSYPFPKVFSNLRPYTKYKLVIASKKSDIVRKIVETLEGAPSSIKQLEVINSTLNAGFIAWKPPDEPRGVILNYTIEIEAEKSIGCSDLGKASYGESNYSLGKQFYFRKVITQTLQNQFEYYLDNLKPYTQYKITVYAATSRYIGEKTECKLTTKIREIPTEVYSNIHLTEASSVLDAATLEWDPPMDCSEISGPISISRVCVRKNGTKDFIQLLSKDYRMPLAKTLFNGAETYELHLYPLRYSDTSENKTSYSSLNFTLPARAPPPVQNAEIVEFDIYSNMKTITLRWEPPAQPIQGSLEYYKINFCLKNQNCNSSVDSFIINTQSYCTLWNLKTALCKDIKVPSTDYDIIQIRAHNFNVTEDSEPVSLPLKKVEPVPSAPLELLSNIKSVKNATVNIFWNHPWTSGGKLDNFTIDIYVINSTLKFQPWNKRTDYVKIDTAGYQPNYAKILQLFPSSTFLISVRARTAGGVYGEIAETLIKTLDSVSFSSSEIAGKANENLTISITIPEVLYDIQGSILIIIVDGSGYCNEELSNNQNVNLLLDAQNWLSGSISWIAARLVEPESYVNKQFNIGDGKIYNGSKNYLLCPDRSYIVHALLCYCSKNIFEDDFDKSILASIKSNAIHLSHVSQNYVAWFTPSLLIVLIVTVLLIIFYRRRLSVDIDKTNPFLTNKSKTDQENICLSNDLTKINNALDEIENMTAIKNGPNNKALITDKPKEFVMPVKVEKFEEYFENAYKYGALIKEYSMIPQGLSRPSTYGSQQEVKSKNRYVNLFPYDDSRVILEKLPDDPSSDYINANFITGSGGKEKAYIATQGPKSNTVVDFWRMIFHANVKIICMMANLIENGKVKCEQYWPLVVGKKVLYGTLTVQFSSEKVYSDYTHRTFRLSCGDEEARVIEHLHYTAWPDHGVPSNILSIVTFLKEIQRHAPTPRKCEDPPIVVHCSAGVGRTGTLIVLDMCICRIYEENVIDVYANLVSVRKERLNMVDNAEQYLLVHLVLVEFLSSQNVCLVCDKTLHEKIIEAKKSSSSQYKRILDTSWWNEILDSSSPPEKPLSNKNRTKHRFPEYAAGKNRLYLKRSAIHDENSDYIAATCVKRIFRNCQYITTQLPMPSTASDFWRMLSEYNVQLVLVLQLPDLQDPTYCELLPENLEFGNTKYLKIVRQEDSRKDSLYYFADEVLIIDSSEPSKKQIVKFVSYKNWSASSLPPPNEIVKFWKSFEQLPKKENCPTVIACHSGVTICGLWLAISLLLNKMINDKECDVPQTVRSVHRCRKDFLNKLEYFDYLYDVALAWEDEC